MAAAFAAAILQLEGNGVMSTVVITGGSRGIGAAAVELFARRGDRVYFLYEKNHEAANAVAEKTGATPIACDVAAAAAVAAAFRRIPDQIYRCHGIWLGFFPQEGNHALSWF